MNRGASRIGEGKTMGGVGPAQLAAVLGLIVAGMVLAAYGWRMARGPEGTTARVEVLSGVGGGLITGFAVGLCVLFLERGFVSAQERAVWRANVEIAESIPGFTPGRRSLNGMHFTGKKMKGADFSGLDLRGMSFRDAELLGADFDDTNLRGVDFTGANLATASFRRADLSDALLLSANLGRAEMRSVKAMTRTQANKATCWPPRLFQERTDLEAQIRAMDWYEDDGNVVRGKGMRGPCPNWNPN
ncbi:pentapeptide repeat-containing protein [Streptomyces sp. NBC_01408]|uniref:pentapeptide repeat-containing protein n=1 Tax=Streptomyces sp. NBC_01408 TaxID=2903855 RepID=UPI00224DA82F|nr:pentapeptide repeat-containing protein [Streptomyces sp. NBC_01408]MCX4693538.1 pentapeptide repeat-containing protein [Streptomyces sp. NBC_01408]